LAQALRRAGRGDEAAGLRVGTDASVPRFEDPWNEAMLDATRGHDAEIDRIDRYLEDGRINDAQRAAQSGLQIWPDDIHLLNRLGEVHHRRNDAASWVRTLQRAVRIDPASFQSHLNLSMARRAAGDHARALQSAIAAVALRGDLPDGHLQVARMHLLGRRPEEAVNALDAAFALGVTDPVERLQYAGTLVSVRRFDEAIVQARDLTQLNPRSVGAWHVLSSAHRGAGQLRLAFEAALAGSQANDNNQQLAALAADIQAQARQAAQVDP
jgi:tetratricopeptide (TPR) repeat protein